MINDVTGFGVHAQRYAIIGTISQPKTCDIRDCDSRGDVPNGRMKDKASLRPEAAAIFQQIDRLGITQRELANVLGIEENKVSKVRSGERQFRAGEVLRANEWLSEIEARDGFRTISEQPNSDPSQEYLSIEVLPTFAGMGGGGNGDGDREVALVPRTLIVDELRGSPTDFLLINVRGDSMRRFSSGGMA